MFKVGDKVRITNIIDYAGERRFIGKRGIVTKLLTDNMTGETPEDPLYEIHCRRAGDSAFWGEEMELV